jgi:hypothetical protein
VKKYYDFDGTLAYFDIWKGHHHTGEPVQPMVQRLKQDLLEGHQVEIFTARITPGGGYDNGKDRAVKNIGDWCSVNVGCRLPVTNIKGDAEVIYDDRAVRIVRNTGLTEGEFLGKIISEELESGTTKEQALNRLLTAIEIIGG